MAIIGDFVKLDRSFYLKPDRSLWLSCWTHALQLQGQYLASRKHYSSHINNLKMHKALSTIHKLLGRNESLINFHSSLGKPTRCYTYPEVDFKSYKRRWVTYLWRYLSKLILLWLKTWRLRLINFAYAFYTNLIIQQKKTYHASLTLSSEPNVQPFQV